MDSDSLSSAKRKVLKTWHVISGSMTKAGVTSVRGVAMHARKKKNHALSRGAEKHTGVLFVFLVAPRHLKMWTFSHTTNCMAAKHPAGHM